MLVGAGASLAGDDVQVVDHGEASQVEYVLAGAAVAGATPYTTMWPAVEDAACMVYGCRDLSRHERRPGKA